MSKILVVQDIEGTVIGAYSTSEELNKHFDENVHINITDIEVDTKPFAFARVIEQTITIDPKDYSMLSMKNLSVYANRSSDNFNKFSIKHLEGNKYIARLELVIDNRPIINFAPHIIFEIMLSKAIDEMKSKGEINFYKEWRDE